AARVTKHTFLFFSVAAVVFLILAVISSLATRAIQRSLAQREVRR
ncbi:MAG: ABC transporter permease, partial [Mesorhizobium sp.]